MLFLKFIFITILILYILKSIGRMIISYLFGGISHKQDGQQNLRQKKKGDVTIFFEEKKKTDREGKVGEYVDYEEIKD
jgi:hypothetical protein